MKKILYLFIVVLLFSAPILLRPYFAARSYLMAARSVSESKLDDKFDAYRRAVMWRSPFNLWSATASHELLQLCQAAGSGAHKASCAQALHSGLQSSRSWYFLIPQTWTGVSEEAALKEVVSAVAPTPVKISELYPPKINFRAQIVSQALFWCWIVLLFRLIWRAFDETGRLVKPIKIQVVTVALAFIGWLLALSQA